MAYRKVLNKFDGHTTVQQLLYTVGRIPERPAQEEGFTPIANEVARPQFINVTHWRVLNEDSGSVVMVSLRDTLTRTQGVSCLPSNSRRHYLRPTTLNRRTRNTRASDALKTL